MDQEEKLRKEYLKQSIEFSCAAKFLQESGKGNNQVIGHLNWTATELALKALAVGHEIPPTHDLDKVTVHLVKNNVVSNSEYNTSLKPLYAHITGAATSYDQARYPSVNPTYWDTVTKEQMDQAIAAGPAVQAFVKDKLRSLAYGR